jgi:hypothetical protein
VVYHREVGIFPGLLPFLCYATRRIPVNKQVTE